MEDPPELAADYNALFGVTISIRAQLNSLLFEPGTDMAPDTRVVQSVSRLLAWSPSFAIKNIVEFA